MRKNKIENLEERQFKVVRVTIYDRGGGSKTEDRRPRTEIAFILPEDFYLQLKEIANVKLIKDVKVTNLNKVP